MLMDRKIFTLNLSVEATSAYILVCTFVEGGAPATVESLGSFWNGPPQGLPPALTVLRSYGIIEEILDERQVRRYLPNPAEFWRAAGG